jgi:hypothetical protein
MLKASAVSLKLPRYKGLIMQWITCKKAYANGKEIPLGTKGEGEVPLNLVGKVQVLIVATPQVEAVAETEPQAETEAEKPKRGR